MTARQHDVLVVGAGPAGATVATLLARKGVDVAIVERDPFPRFHIGESLLPCDLALFRRLGLRIDDATFLYKAGAEFVDENKAERAVYLFEDGLDGTPTHAYQVERAGFDQQLLSLAVDAGAELYCPARARALQVHADHVDLDTDRGRLRGRYFVDASGQAAWLARQRRAIQRIDSLGRVAAFRHYTDLSEASRVELMDTGRGNIRVLILPDGWAWVIPLPGGRLSLGLVTRQPRLPEDAVAGLAASSPMLRELLCGARAHEERHVSDFSYSSADTHGARYVCVGDAALFLDPVFSSGVSLAMLGAEKLADLLEPALRAGSEGDPTTMQPLSEHMRVAYRAFGSLVRAFYNTRLVDHVFFAPEPVPELRRGLISMLAGDVWRDDNPFEQLLQRSRRRLFEPWTVQTR